MYMHTCIYIYTYIYIYVILSKKKKRITPNSRQVYHGEFMGNMMPCAWGCRVAVPGVPLDPDTWCILEIQMDWDAC